MRLRWLAGAAFFFCGFLFAAAAFDFRLLDEQDGGWVPSRQGTRSMPPPANANYGSSFAVSTAGESNRWICLGDGVSHLAGSALVAHECANIQTNKRGGRVSGFATLEMEAPELKLA